MRIGIRPAPGPDLPDHTTKALIELLDRRIPSGVNLTRRYAKCSRPRQFSGGRPPWAHSLRGRQIDKDQIGTFTASADRKPAYRLALLAPDLSYDDQEATMRDSSLSRWKAAQPRAAQSCAGQVPGQHQLLTYDHQRPLLPAVRWTI